MTGDIAVSKGVSVVTPVLGRVPSTKRLLESLREAAEQCPEPVEILIVDDSGPADAGRHREHCRRYGARYVRGPAHVGAKRNLGARLASHDLLLFIDSDCRATPEMLATYVGAIRASPETAGLAGPTLVEGSPTAVFRIMRRSHLLHGDLEQPSSGGGLEWATTSNLLLRRDAFEAVGGFVERSLSSLGGEDVDLGIRLTRGGLPLRAEPDAVAVHDRLSSDTLRAVWRRLYGYGRSEQWLVVVHPDRKVLRCNPVVAVGAAATAAVALAPVSRGWSLLLIPAAAGLALGLRVRSRTAPGAGLRDRFDAVICAVLESAFDLGAVAGAVRLRRPGLLFAGFRPTPKGTDHA